MSVDKTLVLLDQTARSQHGLVTSQQAVKILGPHRKAKWVGRRQLALVQPGVFRLAGVPETWHQSLMATALAADGVVSHRSAAEMWGLIQPAGYVEVSIPPNRTPHLRPPAVAHRIKDLHPELAVERAGLRITDPVRTVIDLGLVLSKREVGDALSRGLSIGLLTVTEVERLRDALGRPGRNGTGVVRHILEARSLQSGTEESLLERRFLDLARRAGLPAPVVQYEVWDSGRFVARIDAAYPSLKIAIEVDGYAPHSSPEAFQRDRTRQNRLVALGWTVLRFTWDDVVRRPTEVARIIEEAIRRAPAA
ncbi:MAG: DUF559 domain-containing protein [Acidimicrobiia bacterium]|jgi:hypothetical protein